MDPQMYPQGRKQFSATALETTPTESDLIATYDATSQNLRAGIALRDLLAGSAAVRNVRLRATIAQVNAGIALVAGVTGYKIRLTGATAIAIGGAVTSVTTVDILGTQSSAVKLVAFGVAALTENTVVRDGNTGGVVLAGGVSYVANDSGIGLTVDITGSDITVATHVDVNVNYVLERA